jgi:predicted PurR-regulated permease PerM
MTEAAPSAPPPSASRSPRWNTATKFLIALVVVTVFGALLSRFQALIAPLVFALILAYILNPVVGWVAARTRLSWGWAVNLTFLALILVLLAALTATGIAIVQQAEGLYRVVAEILPDLPARLEELFAHPIPLGPFTLDFSQPIALGPFTIDLSQADLRPIYDQLLAAIQPALSRTGTFIGTLASGTASLLGWTFFVLLVSFYLLHDLKRVVPSITELLPAGYGHDVQRLAAELGPIWNAFLRGQVTLALVMGLIVGLTMWALGVRYSLVLGLLAGFLEFIPTIGPFIAGLVAVLVALFQPGNWFHIPPLYFALLVAGVQLLLSQLENSVLVPRIIGGSLKLHPIVILVGAIIGANLAGIVGIMLSAPMLATLRLFGRYVYRKMFDLDPWPEPPPPPEPPPKIEWPRLRAALGRLFKPRAAPPPPPPADAPRVDFSYTVYWTKHVRQWDAARRSAVREALRETRSQPGFEANAYERRYTVPGLDAQAHSGASLQALEKVLAAFEGRPHAS